MQHLAPSKCGTPATRSSVHGPTGKHEHERVTVTRNGRPVAVILSPDDWPSSRKPWRSSVTRRPWPTSAKPMLRMPPVISFGESMPFALCGREPQALRTRPDLTRHPGRSIGPARGGSGCGSLSS
jgi:hypothetical protein